MEELEIKLSFHKPFVVFALAGILSITSFAVIAAEKLKGGSLRGSSGVTTTGSVDVVKSNGKQQIVLSGNFSTKKGPSLWVYVGNGSPSKRIGKLKSVKGSQTYTLPSNVDIAQYSSVYIYCRPFQKTFGKAKIK